MLSRGVNCQLKKTMDYQNQEIELRKQMQVSRQLTPTLSDYIVVSVFLDCGHVTLPATNHYNDVAYVTFNIFLRLFSQEHKLLTPTELHAPLVYEWELLMFPCEFLRNLLLPVTTINHINAGQAEDLSVVQQTI